MNNSTNPEINKIHQAINDTLNVETQLKRRKKSESFKNKQLFVAFITELEATLVRQNILINSFGMDNSNYDELFYSIIDKLILLKYGKELTEIISFYLYDRKNPDGTINELINSKGEGFLLENLNQLWELVTKIDPSLEKSVRPKRK